MRKMCAFFTMLFTMAACGNNGVRYVKGNVETIFEKAQQSQKHVFAIIEDKNCGNCTYLTNHIDSQNTTVRLLNSNFICYKAEVQNTHTLPLAQILKCPSYPFPYFFDNSGKVISFGFPTGSRFEVDEFEKIKMDDLLFNELFKLPIPLQHYKELVSLNMEAYLLYTKSKHTKDKQRAYELTKRSLEIAVYPYNLFMAHMIKRELSIADQLENYQLGELTASDSNIYIDLFAKAHRLGIPAFINYSSKKAADRVLVGPVRWANPLSLNRETKFHIDLTNHTEKLISIKAVTDMCSCMKFNWSKEKIQPGETEQIIGVFHPLNRGPFVKTVHIHLNNTKNSIITATISGQVY